MASTSGQGFDSNRSYRRWLAETLDGHETAIDNLNGNADIIKPSFENVPQSLESLEPYIGMVFESAEDAREFYEECGQRVGFTIRNNRTRRSRKDKSIIGREFVCSKEGFRADKYANGGGRILPLRPAATRGGCNAMLRIAAKDGGKWVIYHQDDHIGLHSVRNDISRYFCDILIPVHPLLSLPPSLAAASSLVVVLRHRLLSSPPHLSRLAP